MTPFKKSKAQSSSSSSRMPKPSDSTTSGFDGNDSSEEDDPPQTHFEKMMRNRERKASPDAAHRKEQRRLIAEGWDEDEDMSSPAAYVRQKDHEYRQTGKYCEEIGHAFICLRLAGHSITESIRLLKSDPFKSMIRRWNTTKNSFFAWPNLTQKEREDFQKMPPIISNRGPRLTMIAHDILKLVPRTEVVAKSSQHPLGSGMNKDHVLFEKMIGCFPPAPNFNQYHQFFFSMPFCVKDCVADPGHTPLDLSPRLTNGIEIVEGVQRAYARPCLQKNLFAGYLPCSAHDVPPGAASIQGVKMRRTVVPFVTLSTTSWDDKEYHSLVVDFSDAAHPGIFDPNFGWMELRQGQCMLDLEKILFDCWEHYTGSHSTWSSAIAAKAFNPAFRFEEGFPEFGRKGTRYLDLKQSGRAFFLAAQVHVQSSLAMGATGFEQKSALDRAPSPSPGAGGQIAAFSGSRPPLKRKSSRDDMEK